MKCDETRNREFKPEYFSRNITILYFVFKQNFNALIVCNFWTWNVVEQEAEYLIQDTFPEI